MKIIDPVARDHEPPLAAAAAPLRNDGSSYIHGHLPPAEELKRLETLDKYIRPATRSFLGRVGVTSGMRVLDVGCGAGDVSLLLAELVGPTGEVVGFDRSEPAVSVATARARAQGFTNVKVVQCDIEHVADLARDGLFDAVVSRSVIFHQPKPLEALQNLIRMAHPGGLIGFQEVDVDARFWSTHKVNVLDKLYDYVDKFVERGLMSTNLGFTFIKAFDQAGIVQRRIIRSGAFESATDEDISGMCAWMADLAKVVSTVGPKLGFGPPPFDYRAFGAILAHEVVRTGAAVIPFFWIGAVGRLPSVKSPD